jgi:hypothetical protein
MLPLTVSLCIGQQSNGYCTTEQLDFSGLGGE